MSKYHNLALVGFAFAMICFAHSLLMSQFRSLPSVIYGGDSYYQHGVIEHISRGGAPFESSSMIGGFGGYLPLYPILVSILSKTINIDTTQAMLLFSNFCLVMGFMAWYFLGIKVFEDKVTGLAMSLLAIIFGSFPVIKYTQFGYLVVLPLFLGCLYRFYCQKNIKTALMLGVVLGLSSWTHGILWIGGFVLAHIMWFSGCSNHKNVSKLKSEFYIYLSFLIPAFILFVIAWFKFLLNIKMLGVSKIMQWSVVGYFDNFKQALDLANIYFNHLFSISGIKSSSLLTLLFYFGLYYIFVDKKSCELIKFIRICFVFSLVMIFSFLLTVPLLNTHIAPAYCLIFWGLSSKIFVITYFFFHAVKGRAKSILVIALVAVSCVSVLDVIAKDKEKNIWYSNGLFALEDEYVSMKKFIKDNTKMSETFISTKYLSFLVNSLSGAKLVTNRWAHQIDPTQDFSRRDLDAAHILYGSDKKLRTELIKKYNVKYLFWNSYWDDSMINIDQKNNEIDISDPFMAFYSLANEDELKKNNIPFIRTNFYVDPSYRGKKFVEHDLLIITPKLISKNKRWVEDLESCLEEVWSYRDNNNKKKAIIYRINL